MPSNNGQCQATTAAGAANLDSAHHTHTTTAREGVPGNTQARSADQEAPLPPGEPVEPVEKQRGGDSEGAKEQQRSRDEAKERPEDQTPWTGSSGADQAAEAATPRTESSRDKWRAGALDWIIWGGTNSRSHRPPDCNIRGQEAADAPDWNIPGGTSRRSRRPPDWSFQGQVAADAPDSNIRGGTSSRSRRPADWSIQGQVVEDAPDWNIRGTTRTGRSGHNPQDRNILRKCPDALGRVVRGGSTRRSPHPPDRSGTSTKDNAMEEQIYRAEDAAQGKQRRSPEGEAAVKQRSGHEGKDAVEQRSGH